MATGRRAKSDQTTTDRLVSSTPPDTKRSDGLMATQEGRQHKSPVANPQLEVLECGVCYERMQPPIFQCKEGHTLCELCSTKTAHCPSCRCETIDIRCRALERLAESLEDVACRYQSHGCEFRNKYTELQEHETKCLSKPLVCPDSPRCCFQSSADSLVEHLIDRHRYESFNSSRIHFVCTSHNISSSYDDSGSTIWQKQIYSCHERHYLLRVHRRLECDPQYFISLVGLHGRHHSNRYRLSIEGNHRRYSFEGPVWSVRKGFEEMERVRDCIILPENIVLFLSGGKGSENDIGVVNLTVTGEILPP